VVEDAREAEASRRVDFYVLPGEEPRALLLFACRLIEKAYLAGQHVFVRLADVASLGSFDDLLWTFSDRSFVPHEPAHEPAQWQGCPVLLGCQNAPPAGCDLLLNLGSDVWIPAAEAALRIVEIVDAEPERRQAARERYRRYREGGLNPQTHHIATGAEP
jgi:DNA polymerase-3 subunit chi